MHEVVTVSWRSWRARFVRLVIRTFSHARKLRWRSIWPKHGCRSVECLRCAEKRFKFLLILVDALWLINS